MKIIPEKKINSCAECRYSAGISCIHQGTPYPLGRAVGDFPTIPAWCPLDDYKPMQSKELIFECQDCRSKFTIVNMGKCPLCSQKQYRQQIAQEIFEKFRVAINMQSVYLPTNITENLISWLKALKKEYGL